MKETFTQATPRGSKAGYLRRGSLPKAVAVEPVDFRESIALDNLPAYDRVELDLMPDNHTMGLRMCGDLIPGSLTTWPISVMQEFARQLRAAVPRKPNFVPMGETSNDPMPGGLGQWLQVGTRNGHVTVLFSVLGQETRLLLFGPDAERLAHFLSRTTDASA